MTLVTRDALDLGRLCITERFLSLFYCDVSSFVSPLPFSSITDGRHQIASQIDYLRRKSTRHTSAEKQESHQGKNGFLKIRLCFLLVWRDSK